MVTSLGLLHGFMREAFLRGERLTRAYWPEWPEKRFRDGGCDPSSYASAAFFRQGGPLGKAAFSFTFSTPEKEVKKVLDLDFPLV